MEWCNGGIDCNSIFFLIVPLTIASLLVIWKMLNLDNGDLVHFTTAKWLDCGNLLRVTELLLQIKALKIFFLN